MSTSAAAASAPAPRPAPSKTPPSRPKTPPPQSVEVTVWIPSGASSSLVGTELGANANLGHRVTARCTRWGRQLNGSIVITLQVEASSPAGTLPALGSSGRGEP